MIKKIILASSIFMIISSCGTPKDDNDKSKTPVQSNDQSESKELFEYNIDKRWIDCCNKSCTAGIIDGTIKAKNEWKTEMNKYYNLLLDSLDSASREKMIISQKKWLEFSESEIQFNGQFYGNMDGTMSPVIGNTMTMKLFKNRALQLKDHYGIFTGDAFRP